MGKIINTNKGPALKKSNINNTNATFDTKFINTNIATILSR